MRIEAPAPAAVFNDTTCHNLTEALGEFLATDHNEAVSSSKLLDFLSPWCKIPVPPAELALGTQSAGHVSTLVLSWLTWSWMFKFVFGLCFLMTCFGFISVAAKVWGNLVLAVLSVNVASSFAPYIIAGLFSCSVVSVGVLIWGGLLIYLCI